MRRADLLLGTAALGLVPRVARAQGQALTPLRIAGSPGMTLGEGYFAQQGGFFTQAGLAVETTDLGNGGAITAAVVGGAVDIGITNVGSMAQAFGRGLPIALIFPAVVVQAGSLRPSTAVSVMNESPLRRPKDLAGKIVGVSTLRDLQHAAVLNWLEKNGADPAATNFIEIRVSEMVPVLRSGRIDAAALTEPFLAGARPDVRVLGAPYESIAKQILLSGWMTTRSFLAANPGTVQKFVIAMRNTARWANHHQLQMFAMLETMTKIEHGLTARMGRPILGERLDPTLIQPCIDTVVRYGFLPKAFAAAELIATV
jgi:NitT/TauT family transport system substrate-binding protein